MRENPGNFISGDGAEGGGGDAIEGNEPVEPTP
eukprot:COSAG01_NODE_1009_length_12151_cov_18.810571_14_plen_33_part_00